MKLPTAIARLFLQCPYCSGKNITLSKGRPTVDLKGRTYIGICNDCGHSFTDSSFDSKKVEEKRIDERIDSLIEYGLLEQTGDDQYSFTEKGKQIIKSKNNPRKLIQYHDEILLSVPLWAELSKMVPLHPTRKMVFDAMDVLLKKHGDSQKYNKNVLWTRYSTEVIPALERKAGKIATGIPLLGITIFPNKKQDSIEFTYDEEIMNQIVLGSGNKKSRNFEEICKELNL